MSAGEHLNPSAYIDFKNLPREYDALGPNMTSSSVSISR